jgi:hypothetical protein
MALHAPQVRRVSAPCRTPILSTDERNGMRESREGAQASETCQCLAGLMNDLQRSAAETASAPHFENRREKLTAEPSADRA